jgi:signal transduction histidine kinase
VRHRPALRTELLINLVVLAAGALVLAVVSALLAPSFGDGRIGALLLAVLVAADVAIFIAFGRYLVTRLVTRPLDGLVAATEAVAAGELARRAPPGDTAELDRLAASVNRMTERLLDAQSALVRAEKLATAGRLAAGIAHEVGNPLAAIGTYLEVLRRRGTEPEVIAAVEREAARIDRIVRSLLDYARPRTPDREPLRLTELVATVVELLTAQGALRDRAVTVQHGTDVPAVAGDRTALEQVLVNLLLNAVDAAGPEGAIAVQTAAEVAMARLEVRDSGPGVPAELAGRIFEPFVSTKDPGRGLGLGLAVVQRIVEDHGGTVTVGSAPEGGAAFTVRLPRAPA